MGQSCIARSPCASNSLSWLGCPELACSLIEIGSANNWPHCNKKPGFAECSKHPEYHTPKSPSTHTTSSPSTSSSQILWILPALRCISSTLRTPSTPSAYINPGIPIAPSTPSAPSTLSTPTTQGCQTIERCPSIPSTLSLHRLHICKISGVLKL